MTHPAHTITQTKKRDIIKAIRRHAEGGLDSADMEYISRTQNVPVQVIYGLVDAAGLEVKEEIEIPETPKRTKARTSELVRKAIIEGRIYKRLYNTGPGEPDDDALVFTTVGQLKRERATMMAWLADARDGLG